MNDLKIELEYVKRPIPVKASRWLKNGDHPHDYTKPYKGVTVEHRRACNWEGDVVRYFRHPDNRFSGDKLCTECGVRYHDHGFIDTREGGHRVCPGDWILTGIEGERWPVKPAIFAKTYTLAPTGDSDAKP